jgi:uncharacterized protein YgfB (UPF0149 family)
LSTTELASAALAASRELSSAELHGTVCGMLVGNVRASGLIDGRVHFSVEDYLELVGADAVTSAEAIEDFAILSLAELDAEDLSFVPLLPEDDAHVASRVEALGEWCAAFLAGMGAVADTDLSEVEAEVLDDFVAISAVDADVDAGNDAERQYMELVEYVRVGVMSLLAPAGEEPE